MAEPSQELQQSREKLRSLAAESAIAEERERLRIARELQDHLAKPLTLGRMTLSHVIRQTTMAGVSALLHDIDEIMDRAVKFTESLAVSLTPPVLHEQGFQPALHWLANRMGQQGLAVALRVPQKEPKLDGNHAIIVFQSVRELLFNVLKHAGTMRASVTVAHQPAGCLSVTVKDEGRGFQAGEIEQPGDPHSRFGLFTIKERMAKLNGRLEVQSLPGQGTSVTLVVPCGEPEADQPDGKPETTERLRVLLVDDHAMVREGLRSILESYQDLEVVGEAGDGMEAIKLARTRHPDVVVMDINMPRLDGIAATRQIKHDLPSTAVIGISVQDSSQIERAMLSAGAAKFLTKDRAASQLHDAILQAR
jgi:CheY-like chemotaxis protein